VGGPCSLKKFKHHQFWAFGNKNHNQRTASSRYLKKFRIKEAPVPGTWKKKNQNQRTASLGYLKQKTEAKNHQFWVLEKNQDQRTTCPIFLDYQFPSWQF
jgi:hypothetical protein